MGTQSATENVQISPEYLAGFIDGEGHLGIERIANGKPKAYQRSPNHPVRVYNRSPEHIIRVQIANTNLEGLRAIHRQYGGSLRPMTVPNRPRNRQAYKLTWNSRKAEQLLALVGRHLILKHPQYCLLLEFMEHRQKNRRLGRSNGPLDPEVVAIRDAFHERLKELNRRGPRKGDREALEALSRSETSDVAAGFGNSVALPLTLENP